MFGAKEERQVHEAQACEAQDAQEGPSDPPGAQVLAQVFHQYIRSEFSTLLLRGICDSKRPSFLEHPQHLCGKLLAVHYPVSHVDADNLVESLGGKLKASGIHLEKAYVGPSPQCFPVRSDQRVLGDINPHDLDPPPDIEDMRDLVARANADAEDPVAILQVQLLNTALLQVPIGAQAANRRVVERGVDHVEVRLNESLCDCQRLSPQYRGNDAGASTGRTGPGRPRTP